MFSMFGRTGDPRKRDHRMNKLLQYAEKKSIRLQKGWSQNILGLYQIAVVPVCLPVDDDNLD